MLTVLVGLAEFERELIKARTTGGPGEGKTFWCENGTKAKTQPPPNR